MRDSLPVAVDVYLERRKVNVYVGRLDRIDGLYQFVYDDDYLKGKRIISLGPAFPLTEKRFLCSALFPAFVDRIPDRDNPAYADYCDAFGVSPDETDPFLLLSTIGSRGPSSFVFVGVYESLFTAKKCKEWRKQLGLSAREFGRLFGISPGNIYHMDAGRTSASFILSLLEGYYNCPSAVEYKLNKMGNRLHLIKQHSVREWIRNG